MERRKHVYSEPPSICVLHTIIAFIFCTCSLRKLDVGSLDSSIVMACCRQQKLPNLVAFAGTFIEVHVEQVYCNFGTATTCTCTCTTL